MAKIDAFFKLMNEQGASDLHLVSGQPPALRIRGDIERVKYKILDNDDLKAMLEGGVDRLSRGISIAVFPQTTRSSHFDPEAFNTIGAKLARRAGVPLVPLALRSDAWGTGQLIRDFGPFRPSLPVHFAFGNAMEVKGNGRAEHNAVVEFIGRNLKRWFSEVSPVGQREGR